MYLYCIYIHIQKSNQRQKDASCRKHPSLMDGTNASDACSTPKRPARSSGH